MNSGEPTEGDDGVENRVEGSGVFRDLDGGDHSCVECVGDWRGGDLVENVGNGAEILRGSRLRLLLLLLLLREPVEWEVCQFYRFIVPKREIDLLTSPASFPSNSSKHTHPFLVHPSSPKATSSLADQQRYSASRSLLSKRSESESEQEQEDPFE